MRTQLRTRQTARVGNQGSRRAILQAAITEFSREGVAGARTDAIARAAKVNKALLYYYFEDKESLYGAVLDQVFGGLMDAIMQVLNQNLRPRDKILAYVKTHFDYIASHPKYPRLVQAEMMRMGREQSPQLERMARQYFRPLFAKLAEVLSAGIKAGEFRPVDPMQFIPSMIAVVVFYFTSIPVMRAVTGVDPRTPERLAARKAAIVDLVSAALFETELYPQGANR
jgi:TetR/AcrR family transcriptional regulator